MTRSRFHFQSLKVLHDEIFLLSFGRRDLRNETNFGEPELWHCDYYYSGLKTVEPTVEQNKGIFCRHPGIAE